MEESSAPKLSHLGFQVNDSNQGESVLEPRG